MPDAHQMPDNLVVPAPDHEGAIQQPSKRWPWSKPQVPTTATMRQRRQLRKARSGM